MKLGELIPNEALRRRNPHLFAPAPAPGRGVDREAELHEAIFDECRRRGWIALHGSMAERTCRTLGEPDFVILAGCGRVLFVECKTKTGKLSPAQAALKFHAETLGHTVHVVRSFAEFLAVADGGPGSSRGHEAPMTSEPPHVGCYDGDVDGAHGVTRPTCP